MDILISGMTENQGGIEMYLANLVENFDNDKVSLSFLKEKNDIAYEDILKKNNCSIHEVPWRRRYPVRHIKSLKKLLKEHPEYEAVYINAMSSVCIPTAIAAKQCKRKVILHSRNNNTRYIFIHKILSPVLNNMIDVRYACSELAGRYMFGRKNFEVIPNGIDFSKFKYNEDIRLQMRKRLNIENDTCVIGFVGNLTYQKNVLFLLQVFEAYSRLHSNVKLVMVGDGELRVSLEEKIKEYSLEDKVILCGRQKNPEDYYQAFDIFLFPSRYEGFGNVLIEAQLSGLPCICSRDVISQTTKISEKIEYIYLNDNLDSWVNALDKYTGNPREAFTGNGEEQKYELHYAVAHIQDLLLNI